MSARLKSRKKKSKENRPSSHDHSSSRKHLSLKQILSKSNSKILSQNKSRETLSKCLRSCMKRVYKHHRRTRSDLDQSAKGKSERSLEPPEGVPLGKDNLIKRIAAHFAWNNQPPLTTLDFYVFGKALGKGSFGRVFVGIHQLTGFKVAIKRIDKSIFSDEKTRSKVLQEVNLMKLVAHPTVARLLEVFESRKYLLMVLEYAGGGDLLQLIKTRGRIRESEAKMIFLQVVAAVKACHSVNVAHRDIKLDNVLINTNLTLVKLCDFGVSRAASPGEKVYEQCGTPAYLAPEIIVNKGYDPFLVDIWSLGVLLYAMLSGKVPFKANSLNELHKLILQCKYSFPTHISELAKDLISQMLSPIPYLRIPVGKIHTHSWFQAPDSVEELEESAVPVFTGTEVPKAKKGVDKQALEKANQLGFPSDYIVKSLKAKETNHATATYYLFKQN